MFPFPKGSSGLMVTAGIPFQTSVVFAWPLNTAYHFKSNNVEPIHIYTPFTSFNHWQGIGLTVTDDTEIHIKVKFYYLHHSLALNHT